MRFKSFFTSAKNKTLILSIFILLVLPLISGALPQPVERGNCVNIKIPYNSTSLNITTITHPNQTMIFVNAEASLNGSTFFYDGFCDTDQIGIYTYEFLASDGFTSGNSFTVTESGDSFETSQSIIYFPLLIINLLFLFLFLFISIKIPYGNIEVMTQRGPAITKISKLKYLKLLAIWFTYGLFFWLITIIAGMVNNYISFQPLKDMAMNLYFFTSTLNYVIAVTMVWFLFYNLWKDIVLNKTILNEGKAMLNQRG